MHCDPTGSDLPAPTQRTGASPLLQQLLGNADPTGPSSVDDAFLWLVSCGLVTTHPHDLVTQTLETVRTAAEAAA